MHLGLLGPDVPYFYYRLGKVAVVTMLFGHDPEALLHVEGQMLGNRGSIVAGAENLVVDRHDQGAQRVFLTVKEVLALRFWWFCMPQSIYQRLNW